VILSDGTSNVHTRTQYTTKHMWDGTSNVHTRTQYTTTHVGWNVKCSHQNPVHHNTHVGRNVKSPHQNPVHYNTHVGRNVKSPHQNPVHHNTHVGWNVKRPHQNPVHHNTHAYTVHQSFRYHLLSVLTAMCPSFRQPHTHYLTEHDFNNQFPHLAQLCLTRCLWDAGLIAVTRYMPFLAPNEQCRTIDDYFQVLGSHTRNTTLNVLCCILCFGKSCSSWFFWILYCV